MLNTTPGRGTEQTFFLGLQIMGFKWDLFKFLADID